MFYNFFFTNLILDIRGMFAVRFITRIEIGQMKTFLIFCPDTCKISACHWKDPQKKEHDKALLDMKFLNSSKDFQVTPTGTKIKNKFRNKIHKKKKFKSPHLLGLLKFCLYVACYIVDKTLLNWIWKEKTIKKPNPRLALIEKQFHLTKKVIENSLTIL